ncbi:MAG: hypothetical protein EOQ86_30210 [Mesorhizobium sp.]|uniref:hypothetical protein n=1 Tax=Mesorhizobium sp. TaxID=1871066 RepID=UPI000FE4CE93|nr:hypothetical protein [Mesorhizobium sp.]RWH69470.1 MAG: hypothetical protein EOQ85_32795 [Mesorhizobium sp.]RWH76336.1 MAG: hypothetical protein EOQ86_30210 [Mesorhizobium sp.]RWH83534.1 MAG: hypothetical protein EOQ87_32790 [Mesorhizobium sp.]RWH91551.1 MAG: hypothetical protein EOQ88_31805 [Mesorhizobium sp.]RWH95823.1 MAG: hypothetical protein EOQ89_30460 [Mesorhizobium sp.]
MAGRINLAAVVSAAIFLVCSVAAAAATEITGTCVNEKLFPAVALDKNDLEYLKELKRSGLPIPNMYKPKQMPASTRISKDLETFLRGKTILYNGWKTNLTYFNQDWSTLNYDRSTGLLTTRAWQVSKAQGKPEELCMAWNDGTNNCSQLFVFKKAGHGSASEEGSFVIDPNAALLIKNFEACRKIDPAYADLWVPIWLESGITLEAKDAAKGLEEKNQQKNNEDKLQSAELSELDLQNIADYMKYGLITATCDDKGALPEGIDIEAVKSRLRSFLSKYSKEQMDLALKNRPDVGLLAMQLQSTPDFGIFGLCQKLSDNGFPALH